MAVIREYYRTRDDGVVLYKSYSDANKYLVQIPTGTRYEEAIDVETTPYTYAESEDEIQPDPQPEPPEPVDPNEITPDEVYDALEELL